jgi:hypothetical protein
VPLRDRELGPSRFEWPPKGLASKCVSPTLFKPQRQARYCVDSERARHAEIGALLLEHNDALINCVNSWVHSRADALDIVQRRQVFRLGEPTAGSRMRAFLFKIAKNIAADFWTCPA